MYTGHTKYVHSLSLRPSTNQFLSGSEDGTVKVWGMCAICVGP